MINHDPYNPHRHWDGSEDQAHEQTRTSAPHAHDPEFSARVTQWLKETFGECDRSEDVDLSFILSQKVA
jgi:hypothetical protein